MNKGITYIWLNNNGNKMKNLTESIVITRDKKIIAKCYDVNDEIHAVVVSYRITDREKMVQKLGEDVRQLVKTYTDIDTHDLYKWKQL